MEFCIMKNVAYGRAFVFLAEIGERPFTFRTEVEGGPS